MSMVAIGIGAGVALGGVQMATSGKGKAQRALEAQANNSPMMTGNKGISDYYEQQKARANANPYASASYLNSINNINLSTASGLAALQGRGAAIGGVGRLGAMSNQAKGNAISQAENQSNAAQARYGQAAGMAAADQKAVWNNNVLDPYQRKLQLAQMKAKAANDQFNNGMSMIGNSVSAAGSIGAAKAYGAAANGVKPTKTLGPGQINAENYAPSQQWLTRTNYASDPDNSPMQYP